MDHFASLKAAGKYGKEVGRKEGERKKAIDASKKMIQDGLSLELISKMMDYFSVAEKWRCNVFLKFIDKPQ